MERLAYSVKEGREQAVRYDHDDVLHGAGTGIVYVGPVEKRASQIGARACKVCGCPTLDSGGVCNTCRRRGAELRARLFGREGRR